MLPTELPTEQLDRIRERYQALNQQLADPDVVTNPDRLREIGQEQAKLQPIVTAYKEYREVSGELDETRMLHEEESSPDMVELIEAEIASLESRRQALMGQLEELLLPTDPNDERNAIVEIRAGTGGDEAGLFAGDLFSMYARYAESRGWKVAVISQSPTDLGGFKEVIFEVRGDGAFGRFKWESGVHRVQRVPETETQGRIHTSTATVAVLPEMDEIEVRIPEHEIRIDVFRSSGPGGQSVNTTDSAVRVTHEPTGIVVSCQDEKSQLQNRRKALQVLRARLYQREEERRLEEIGAARRSQVGSAQRAEKIRTYNFPQSRVTDHRVGLTTHNLEGVLAGEIDEFIEALIAKDRNEQLEAQRSGAVDGTP